MTDSPQQQLWDRISKMNDELKAAPSAAMRPQEIAIDGDTRFLVLMTPEFYQLVCHYCIKDSRIDPSLIKGG